MYWRIIIRFGIWNILINIIIIFENKSFNLLLCFLLCYVDPEKYFQLNLEEATNELFVFDNRGSLVSFLSKKSAIQSLPLLVFAFADLAGCFKFIFTEKSGHLFLN